ncbi:MAG: Rieske 2Fe-2S domain-containing protein [Candidatus Sumerlaeaceae bacterium]|nr:Rieske 2Fe-2S domain-containing protein [Candidatus Sumerlaeaceae bacterium]
MSNVIKVAKHGEMKNGEARSVTVDGTPIAVFYVDGHYYALADSCCHRGGPLSEGTVDGTKVACPWHGWEFDLVTGACETEPSARQPVFEVRVDGDDVVLVLPN